MAHLSPRKAGARRARDRDVWSSTSESRLGQRSLVGSVMMKNVSLSTDQAYRPKRTALPGTVLMDCWQSSPVESTSVLHSGHHWSGLPTWVPGVVP